MKAKKSLTYKILDFFRTRKQAPLDELVKIYPQKTRSIYTLANRLEQTGLLQKQKLQHGRRLRSFFRLTKKGQEKFITKDLVRTRPAWDGVWRLLVFDVPEIEKSKREYLRSELKDRGFYMLQLSVWVTPYPVDNDLLELIEEIGVKPYVRFMVVKEVNYEKDMLQFFGLF